MAHMTIANHAAPAAPLRAGFGRFVAGVVGRSRARRDYRRLEGMSDRMLRDIGLSRSDVRSARREVDLFRF